MKPLEFLGSSRDDLVSMPAKVKHDLVKPMPAVGAGACEIRVRDASGAFRAMYVAKFETAVYVLHAFQK